MMEQPRKNPSMETESRSGIGREGEDLASLVASLEPDQLTSAKETHHCPRRNLTRTEMVLFWALRIYLVFMFGVVLYQAVTAVGHLRREHASSSLSCSIGSLLYGALAEQTNSIRPVPGIDSYFMAGAAGIGVVRFACLFEICISVLRRS
jgi:hypothetical protein